MNPKISVIVPVYNTEKYLRKCVESLMRQSLSSMEYIFVDDCSTDKSLELLREIIDEYPSRKEQVTIITHISNQGVAAARKTGLEFANGAYIGFCDSDDEVAPKMYESLYGLTQLNDYDVAISNYYEVFNTMQVEHNVHVDDEGNKYVKNLLVGSLGSFLWNKVFRRELFDNIIIKDGADLWEDMLMSVQLFHKAKKVGFYDEEPLYYYNQTNLSAITSRVRSSDIDSMIENVKLIDSFLYKNNINIEYTYQRKIRCKLLMLTKHYRIDEWHNIFTEVNSRLTHDKNISWHLRIRVWFLNYGMVSFNKLLSIIAKQMDFHCS